MEQKPQPLMLPLIGRTSEMLLMRKGNVLLLYTKIVAERLPVVEVGVVIVELIMLV